MDLLNRALIRSSELFRAMSPRARMTAGMLLALLVIGAAYLFVLQSRGSQVDLLGGHVFTVAEIRAAQVAFGKAGLNDFEVEAAQIKVPKHKHDLYLAAMADANVLPPDFGDYLMKTIKEQSPWTGSRLQDQALLAAHQRVLSHSISQMQGIESAQVFISVLDKPSFRGERLVTASVDVKTIGNRPLDSRQVRAIRSLVAGGTAGLKRHQITVVDSTGHDFPGMDHGGLDEFDEACFARQEAFEQRFEEAILKILSYLPGAAVSVHVELAPRQRGGKAIDPGAAAADAAGAATEQPAQSPHAANTQAALQPTPQPTDASPPDAARLVAAPASTETVTPQDYVPSHVTASVTVPGSYFEDAWRWNQLQPGKRGDAATADATAFREQLCQQVQRQVLAVIPHDAGADPSQLVSVTSFDPIPDRRETAASPPENPAHIRSTTPWRIAGMCAVVVAGLLLLWSLLPSAKSHPAVAARSASPVGEARSTGAETSPLRSLRKRPGSGSGSLSDDLAEVVRENPDAAASILRTWIGDAS